MSDYKVTIGDVEIVSLSDGRLEAAVTDIFPSVPAKAWEPYRGQLMPDGKAAFNLGSFLIRSGGKTVLVDTGLGPNKQEERDIVWGQLLGDLRHKGIGLDEIDMVVMTHLHRDHVGWNVIRDKGFYRPTFPRARYLVPKHDWESLKSGAATRLFPHVKDQVLPLERLGLLEFMEGEETLTGELTTLPTPGHTPGHTCLVISSRGERGIILGDIAHHPAQVQETDWCPFFDVDQALSRTTRRRLMERLERDGSLAAAAHFPAPGFGRIVRLHGRRRWQPV